MLEPGPELADVPLRVQAVVSDWGCGRLKDKRVHALSRRWLGPEDPPLLTCHNVEGEVPEGPRLYRESGAVAEVVHLKVKNTHVPKGDSPVVGKGGRPTTWHDRIYQFLDEYVKHPTRATAPEAVPAGGPVSGPVRVMLRTVHGDGSIHFTTDGSEPTDAAPVYRFPVTVEPGQTLKAIAVKPPLEPSAVGTFAFAKASRPAPVITPGEMHLTATVGRRFEARFAATGEGVRWYLSGRRGNVVDRGKNPPKLVPWLAIDRETGLLSGTPDAIGYAVVLVTAVAGDGAEARCDSRRVLVAAREP
jgi:hypothetical protein